MAKYTNLAKEIIKNVGGKENVKDLKHCVTRLRFNLVDESKANDDVLKNMDGVVTIVKAAGQYMVVIGQHVTDVFDEVCAQLGTVGAPAATAQPSKEKKSIREAFMELILCGIASVMNLMCACGIIKGLLVVASICGMPAESGLYQLLNAAGDCIFYSLPLIVGFNVAKKKGIDPFFGLLFGAAMTYPAIQGVDLNILGWTVNASYSSSFLPILFGMLAAVPVYKFLNAHIHSMLKGFLAPMLTLIFIFPLTFAVIGPLANLIGAGLNWALNIVFVASPVLAGALLGGFWQFFVMFGVHGVISMFSFYDMLAGNPSPILALATGTSFAITGALLGYALKEKNKNKKATAMSATISGALGVTEPGLYGIVAPNKKLFTITCLAGAIGGTVTALIGAQIYSYAGLGIVGLLGLLDPVSPNLLALILVPAVPFVSALLMTLVAYKKEEKKTVAPVQSNENEAAHILHAPVAGIVEPLSSCSDEVFAVETLGKGCLIQPENGQVTAPCAGTVTTLFPTKHAIGITNEKGAEILIHIGINTVNLNGEGFVSHIQQGDTVEQGQLLVEFNRELIEKNGLSCEIPVIITNSASFADVICKAEGGCALGDPLLQLV